MEPETCQRLPVLWQQFRAGLTAFLLNEFKSLWKIWFSRSKVSDFFAPFFWEWSNSVGSLAANQRDSKARRGGSSVALTCFGQIQTTAQQMHCSSGCFFLIEVLCWCQCLDHFFVVVAAAVGVVVVVVVVDVFFAFLLIFCSILIEHWFKFQEWDCAS